MTPLWGVATGYLLSVSALNFCSCSCYGYDVASIDEKVNSWDLQGTTSRRNLLSASAASAAALSRWYSSSSTYMADPSAFITKSTKLLLAKQTLEAVSRVTDNNIKEYQRHGVTKISHVISPEWIDLLRTGCETAQDEAGPSAEYLNQSTDEGIFFTDLEMARRLPVFAAFSMYSPVAAVAGTLMGSNTVRYLYDQLFIKEKGVSTKTPWHQDGGY